MSFRSVIDVGQIPSKPRSGGQDPQMHGVAFSPNTPTSAPPLTHLQICSNTPCSGGQDRQRHGVAFSPNIPTSATEPEYALTVADPQQRNVEENLMSDTELDLNQTLKDGYTYLHLAAESGELEYVSQLIANGANIYQTRDGGNMPLHDAAEAGHTDLVQLLSNAKRQKKSE